MHTNTKQKRKNITEFKLKFVDTLRLCCTTMSTYLPNMPNDLVDICGINTTQYPNFNREVIKLDCR